GLCGSETASRQHGFQASPRIQKLLRERASRAAVSRVIRVDVGHSGHGFLQVAKNYQAVARRKAVPETGVFGKYRTATRKVAGAAVAKPTRFQLSKDRFGTRDFRAGPADILLIERRRGCYLVRIDQAPISASQKLAVTRVIVWVNIRRQLKCSPG